MLLTEIINETGKGIVALLPLMEATISDSNVIILNFENLNFKPIPFKILRKATIEEFLAQPLEHDPLQIYKRAKVERWSFYEITTD